MKIGKITTLLCLLAAGTLTSVAQLSWVYEGKTLTEKETIRVVGNVEEFAITGVYMSIANASDQKMSVTVSKQIGENDGFDVAMCLGTINCYPPEKDITDPFDVPANGKYEEFHVTVGPRGIEEGEVHVTFTANGSGSSATVNVVFVLDNTGGVNDVTGNGKGFGITYANDVLTVSGASAGQQVRVVDITGRVAASMPVDGDGVQRYDLNLGRGIYLVAVQEAGRTVAVQKVIVR